MVYAWPMTCHSKTKAISVGICGAELKSFGVEWQGNIQNVFSLHFVSRVVRKKKAKKKNVFHIFHKEIALLFWAPPSVSAINVLFGQH